MPTTTQNDDAVIVELEQDIRMAMIDAKSNPKTPKSTYYYHIIDKLRALLTKHRTELEEAYNEGFEEARSAFETECQWENCSGGQYCEKHSLQKKPTPTLPTDTKHT